MQIDKPPKAIKSVVKLLQYLELDITQVNYSKTAENLFPFQVPISFIQRMRKRSPADPLLLQVLPQARENLTFDDFTDDPLKEHQISLIPGIMQKYQHRLLLMPTASCGIHCRYCFRRNYPYQQNQISKDKLEQQIQWINEHSNISEVILSGGDPLSLNDDKIEAILNQLAVIEHIKRLRIHTRQIIVSPERITKKLISMLNQIRFPICLVIHCNHPNELNLEIKNTLKNLNLENIQLLNQSVLLKNINDNSYSLIELSEKLFDYGVLPYYLHLLDHVSGSQHFQVNEDKAIEIHQQLKKKLPGYLVPRLVKEVPGENFKVDIY